MTWMRLAAGVVLSTALAAAIVWLLLRTDGDEQRRFERGEMRVFVRNTAAAAVLLYRAGNTLAAAAPARPEDGGMSLPQGNYFIQASHPKGTFFYPVPVLGYRAGPEPDGSFLVTVRAAPAEFPPRLPAGSAASAYIPGGHFLMGDRLNPRERHYVWTTSFFATPFEITNGEFREFLRDPSGYGDDANWTAAGRRWKSSSHSQATALLPPGDPEFERFGQPDDPVVNVTWFEANACCHWLTKKLGAGRWIFSLPTDAEWEKAARGPDNFDYGLGMTISDAEVPLYNWKKNPGVPVTVVGIVRSRSAYTPNRYGLYHVSGNAAEWTQSIFRPYGKELPYADDDRNRDEGSERRTARGGSWYSATTAPLYIPYRDAFQPDHAGNDLGFRVVARLP